MPFQTLNESQQIIVNDIAGYLNYFRSALNGQKVEFYQGGRSYQELAEQAKKLGIKNLGRYNRQYKSLVKKTRKRTGESITVLENFFKTHDNFLAEDEFDFIESRSYKLFAKLKKLKVPTWHEHTYILLRQAIRERAIQLEKKLREEYYAIRPEEDESFGNQSDKFDDIPAPSIEELMRLETESELEDA